MPYVISRHGGKLAVPKDEQDPGRPPRERWSGAVARLLGGFPRVLDDASAIICVGRTIRGHVQRFPGRWLNISPTESIIARSRMGMGWLPYCAGIPADRFVCLTVARLDVQKIQLGLVRQLPALREVPMPSTVSRSCDHRAYVESVPRKPALGVLDRVTIVPGVPYADQALVDAYHSADCFTLPSLHEPFGMVVLEAWASGLPVAVSQRGGLAALITDGVEGCSTILKLQPKIRASMAAVIASLARCFLTELLRRGGPRHSHRLV